VIPVVFQGDLAREVLDAEDNAVIVAGKIRMGIGDFRDTDTVMAIWATSIEFLGTVPDGLPF